jgi:alpha/beta superfamily hydrolase
MVTAEAATGSPARRLAMRATFKPCSASGIAPPVARDGYTFPNTLETTKPKFLVQGALDELCPLKDLWAFYAKLKDPKELVVIDGASHLFDGKTREVGEALEDLLGDFEQ